MNLLNLQHQIKFMFVNQKSVIPILGTKYRCDLWVFVVNSQRLCCKFTKVIFQIHKGYVVNSQRLKCSKKK